MLQRAEVDAEQMELADLRAASTARAVGVGQDEALEREGHAEGDDREVDPACAQRGKADDEAERDGAEDADEDGELVADAGRRDEAARDVGAHAGHRVLRERQLAGEAGEHDEREEHDRVRERGGERFDPAH